MRTKTILTLLLTAATVYSYAQTAKASILQGGSAKKTGATYALIVGVSNYEQLPKLSFAHKDAYALRDYLLQVQKLPLSNVFTFINDSATSLNIIDKLYLISDSLKDGDRFLFYFSGHGDWESKISDNSLLLLGKAPKQNYLRYPDQFISCQTVNEFLKKLSERNVKTVLIADACRSGNLVGGQSGAEVTNLQLKQSWKNDIRILSCMPDEYSFEHPKWGGGRGVFSYYLTQGLMGMDKTETDKTIDITIGELRSYLESNIRKETEGKQNPVFEGDSRMIIASVNRKDIIQAKIENSAASDAVAMARGNFDTTSGEYKGLLQQLNQQLLNNQIAEPYSNCAFATYRALLKLVPDDILHQSYSQLLAAVNANYIAYTKNFYEEIGFSEDALYNLKAQLTAAAKLVERKPVLYNQFYSRKLFIEACISTYSAQHGLNKEIGAEDLQNAIDSLEKGVKLNPYEPALYKKLGECYLAMKSDKAVPTLQTYLRLLPNDPMTYNSIGLALYQQKKYAEAVRYFQSSINLDERNAKFLYNMGMCYKAMGDEGRAAHYFKRSQNAGQPNLGIEY